MTFTNAATITLANNAAALNIDSGLMVFNSLNNRIGINTGANTMLAALDVRGSLNTQPTASISATSSFAALVVDNTKGPLFTASSSGMPRFVITQGGNVGINTQNPTNTLSINSQVTNYSGLQFTQLNSNSSVSSNYSQLLGLDTLGNVGLSSAGISLTSPALAYWDATGDPAVANQSYPQAAPLSLGATTYTPNWTSGNGEQLTDTNASGYETGDINWKFSQVPFEEIQFQFKASPGGASPDGADSTWFYGYGDDIPTTEYGNATGSTHNFTKGYLIYFSEYHSCAGISYGVYTDGNQCTAGAQGTYPMAAAPLYNVADGKFHAVDIQILYNQIVVRWDGNVILTATDSFGRDVSNLNFGFASRTGGQYDNHYIKGLLVTKLGTNTSQYYVSSNVSPLASGLYWNNGGTAPAKTTGLGALGIGVTNPQYTLTTNGTFDINAPVYNIGTVCQASTNACLTTQAAGYVPVAGTNIYGSGTTFTAAMVGDIITMSDGIQETITGYTSATQISVGAVNSRVSSLGTYSINAPQTLMVSNTNYSLPAVNIGGMNAYAALSVNNSSTGDIFTASGSGTTRFTIRQNGSINAAAATTTGNLYNFDMAGSPTLTGDTTGINLDVSGTSATTHALTALNIASFQGGSTTNTGINLAGLVTTNGANNYGINVGALSGSGTNNAAINIATLTSTGTTSTGLNIVGLSGNATTNYGINIGTVNGTGTDYGLNIAGSSAITNVYGIRLQNISASATDYSIYADALAKSYFAGSVGIGTTTPRAQLDVTQNGTATASAFIENAATGTGGVGLAVKLGATTFNLANHFANFLDYNGKIIGDIRMASATSVAYQTGGIADFAEYLKKDSNLSIDWGSVLCQNDQGNVEPCANANASAHVVGVASQFPSFVGGEDLGDSSITVGLTGVVSTQVVGDIKSGDYIAMSDLAGVGTKATTAGQVVGVALEDYDSDQVGKIQVKVAPSWYDPQVQLTDTGNLNLIDQNSSDTNFTIPHYYTLNDVLGNPLQRVGEFSDAAIANLKAGFVSAGQVTTNALSVATENVTINGQSLKDYITSVVNEVLGNQSGGPTPENMHADLITPLASDSALAIKFDNTKLSILNSNSATGSAVATIDNQGNASFSGSLTSDNLITNNGTVAGTLNVATLTANNINLSSQALADLSTQLSTASGFAINGNFQIDGQLTAGSSSFGSEGQLSVDGNGNLTTSGNISLSNGTISSDTNGDVINQLASDTNNSNPTKFTFKNAAGANVFSVDSNGNAALSGTLTTSSGTYDLAEDYPTSDNSIEAGDVLSIDQTSDGLIQKSNGAYDTSVIGIYSEKPGFRLSETNATNGDKNVPIALAGRVPVKVSTENGAIHTGDYLTTSSIAGVAMKATKPGQAIGKALQDFDKTGIGKIMVFVNISFADPKKALANIITDDNGNIAISNVSSTSIVLPQNLRIGSKEIGGTLNNALLAISDAITTHENKLNTLQTDVLGLATESAGLSSKVDNLEASASSQLAQANDKVASTAADVVSLNKKVDDIISSLSAVAAAPYNVSSAADLGLGNDVQLSTATISGNLNVLGQTTVNDLGVTGNVSMGLLKINGLDDNGTASINTLSGDLNLQNYGLGGLNILSGKVVIDKSGNVNIQQAVSAKTVNTTKLNIVTDTATTSAALSASAGTATINANTNSVTIKTTAVTNNSLIYITFNGDYSPAVRYWIDTKVAGNSFTVKLDAAVNNSVKFNWWIVN
jgi:hypothetical protein